jgi:V/A-type H+-transporting ATPase subunit F
MTGKMAIVGSGDGILVFKAAGVDAYSVPDAKRAKDVLRHIAKDHAIIFLTEDLARPLAEYLKIFDEQAYPVILTIPADSGSTGYGYEIIQNAMERALGVDILNN